MNANSSLSSLDNHVNVNVNVNFFDDSTNDCWVQDDVLSISSMFAFPSWTMTTTATSASSTNNNNVSNVSNVYHVNYSFSLPNAPRIRSIPLPVVEETIPFHPGDAAIPFPYLPTPPPTPPSLTFYLLSPRPSLHHRDSRSSQQSRMSVSSTETGRIVNRSRPTNSVSSFDDTITTTTTSTTFGPLPLPLPLPLALSRSSTSTPSRPRRATIRPADPGQLLRAVSRKRRVLVRRVNPVQDIESYLDSLELFDADVPSSPMQMTRPD